jgi:uncharacterized membrane protein YhhN
MAISLALTLAAIVSGSIYVWITYAGSPTLRYIFKPLTTALILGLALLLPDAISPLYRALIAAGILFSLGGDIFPDAAARPPLCGDWQAFSSPIFSTSLRTSPAPACR